MSGIEGRVVAITGARTLNQALRHESLTGSSDRHLAAAVTGPRQQEIGDVCTSDQQNASYGSHQQQ